MQTATTDKWQTMFDSWAGGDALLASTGGLAHPDELAATALQLGDWLQLRDDNRVLDVGCASGTLTSMWAPRAGTVVGVDYSDRLLDDAERRHGGGNMNFVHADASALPFADASFDRVVSFSMLLCLPDRDCVARAIDEMIRVARPECRIVLGGLPDQACRSTFFDHCDSFLPWYHRLVPRDLRWLAKRVLKPGSRPGQTEILWFDPSALAADLRRRGFTVEICLDPELSNYASYRKSLVLTRGGGAEGA